MSKIVMPKRLLQCTDELWQVLDLYADGRALNPLIEELLWSHPEVSGVAIQYGIPRTPRSTPGSMRWAGHQRTDKPTSVGDDL